MSFDPRLGECVSRDQHINATVTISFMLVYTFCTKLALSCLTWHI